MARLKVLEIAEEKGIEKGMEKGIEKGMEKGMEKGKIENSKKILEMIKEGYTLEQIEKKLYEEINL